VEPSGGATIDHLIVYEHGWVSVFMVETLSLVDQYCNVMPSPNASTQALIGRRQIFLNLGTTSGKQLYSTLLLAKAMDKKLAGFSIYQPSPGWCEIYSARVAF
jgi:hypothetical protein